MTTVYKERKVKQLMEVLIAGPGDPRYDLIFQEGLILHIPDKKRVGRPRLEWAKITLQELWVAVT
eukprot:5897466-Prorocentrum_lima.AAC.1